MLKLVRLAVLAAASLLLTTTGFAQTHEPSGHQHNFTPVPAGMITCLDDPSLQPGDFGYMHCRDHAVLQELFSKAPVFKAADSNCVDDPSLKPGDKGYMKCRYQSAMQKVFSSGKCYCTSGHCRATDWKADARSPVGLAFKIDGKYCPVNTYIDPRVVKIPDELTTEPGYICYEDSAPRGADGCPPMVDINCTIYNGPS